MEFATALIASRECGAPPAWPSAVRQRSLVATPLAVVWTREASRERPDTARIEQADPLLATGCGARLAAVSHQRFTFLVQQTPGFAIHVMRVLVGRLRRTTQRV